MATVTGKTADAMDAIMAGVIVGATIDGSGHLILTKNDASTVDAGAVLGSVPNASTSVSGVTKYADNGTTSTGTSTTTAVTPAGLASVLSGISTAIAACQPGDTDLTAIAGLTPANNDIIQRKSGAWINRTMAQLLTDLSSALSTIAGLSPAANDVLQYKSGAWANRTMAQLLTDLSTQLSAINGLSPTANDFMQYKSSAWANRTPTQAAVDLAAIGVALGYLYNGSAYVAVNTPGVYVGSADPGSVANGSVWYAV